MDKLLKFLTLLYIVPLIGCGSSDETASHSSDKTKNRVHVTKADFGKDWPLTVDEGDLAHEGEAITFTADGITYALNGIALQMAPERGWVGISDSTIWSKSKDPFMAKGGYKMDIGPLIDRGRDLPGK